MRSRNLWPTRVLDYISCCILALACMHQIASAQIKAMAAGHLPVPAVPRPNAQTQTSLALNLCVDGSTTYPCPTPITADGTYIPAIQLTYGQILDGVIIYGPPSLTDGTITLFRDDTPVCTLRIGIDLACPANSTIFDVGNYTLTATLTFPSGSIYDSSTAFPVTVSVAKDPTSLTMSSSMNPAPQGTLLTFKALASGNYPATPTGQIVFTVDGVTLAPATIDTTGTASFSTSALLLGTHTITASYAGALDFLPATEASFMQQITPPASATTLTSSLNPSAVGENVTFTASVTAPGTTGATPKGSVTFNDGTTKFATMPITPKGGAEVAQTTISTLAAGTHNITATYAGDAANSASVSPALVQQVNYPLTPAGSGYIITVTPSPISVGIGETANLTVTIDETGSFSQPVTLDCSNLPTESACIFGSATILAGGGTTTLNLSTMSPHDCGSTIPYGSAGLQYIAPALSGALLLLLSRRRRPLLPRLLALAVLLYSGSLALTGCSSRCTDFGTIPGSYTFKVNATAPIPVTVGTTATTTTTQTASVALTVKI